VTAQELANWKNLMQLLSKSIICVEPLAFYIKTNKKGGKEEIMQVMWTIRFFSGSSR